MIYPKTITHLYRRNCDPMAIRIFYKLLKDVAELAWNKYVGIFKLFQRHTNSVFDSNWNTCETLSHGHVDTKILFNLSLKIFYYSLKAH